MMVKLDIIYRYKIWKRHKSIHKNFIKRVVQSTLSKLENFQHVRCCEISILLTEDSEMLELNSEFCNKPKATDVLSFPDLEIDSDNVSSFKPDLRYMYLGDVAFGYQIIEEVSSRDYKIFENHFTHLLVHSVLHLVGFDHKSDSQAKVMEDLEIQILKELGITSPYE